MEKGNQKAESMRDEFLEICPDAIRMLQELITDPDTPVMARVQLIGIVLDRALGKLETPVKVSTEDTSFEEAEAMLMEIVREIQVEEGMIPKLGETEEMSDCEGGNGRGRSFRFSIRCNCKDRPRRFTRAASE